MRFPQPGETIIGGEMFDNFLLVREGRLREAELREHLGTGPWPARNPDQTIADLRAQIAANEKGVQELRAMVAQFGRETVAAYMKHVQDNAEESVRRVITALITVVMGSISMNVPAIFCSAGPMLNDRYLKPGQPAMNVGAGTHTRMFWDEYRAGRIGEDEWVALEAHMTRSPGTCNTMGTASTMTSIVEALGLALPGSTAIPAMDAAHVRMATTCGERIVQMVWDNVTPRSILTRGAFMNAVAVQMALGGSTNAAVHLIAMAGRAGVPRTAYDFSDGSGMSSYNRLSPRATVALLRHTPRPTNADIDAALAATVQRLSDEGRTRAMVLRSTGKHFSAGMALEVFAEGPQGEAAPPSGVDQSQRSVISASLCASARTKVSCVVAIGRLTASGLLVSTRLLVSMALSYCFKLK